MRGDFIFGHSPTLYERGTSALFIGLPATHLLLTTHKWVPWVEYTQLITFLFSFKSLPYICFNRFCALPHGIHVISLTPKFAVSVRKLHIPPLLKYHSRTFPFQIPHKARNAHFGRDAHQHVYLIWIYLSLYDLYSSPLT